MASNLIITDPKRTRSQNGRSAWYPYYAGFSYDFAYKLIESADLPKDTIVLDDWNGSGTTTAAANALGFQTCGFDLNPVMVVVAKARLLSITEHSSMEPLSAEIIDKATVDSYEASTDPLDVWFQPQSANDVRRLEKAIRHLLVNHEHYELAATCYDFDNLSGTGAFLYLALFRTVRTLLKAFVASNPTWIKTPQTLQHRLRPSTEAIFCVFRSEVLSMVKACQEGLFERQEPGNVEIRVANSESLPLAEKSIRFALTSPPYCTRIDYAVATGPELAVLGYNQEKLRALREGLMGTSTVPRNAPEENKEWGRTCLRFLRQVRCHKSRASDTYYYKNHLQYFHCLYNSLLELRRVMMTNGQCILVVQDSFYKDIQNDLPRIVTDMALAHGFSLTRKEEFSHVRTMAAVNPAVRRYRKIFTAKESVLVFKSSTH